MSEKEQEKITEFELEELEQKIAPNLVVSCGGCTGCSNCSSTCTCCICLPTE